MAQLRTILTGCLAAALSIGATDSALADASRGGNSSATPRDSQYAEAERAVKRGDYPAAIRLLEGVVAKDQRNADAYNLLAYSIRKSGDPGKSIPIYEKALAIDPKHKGAHEYIGEAYLIVHNLVKAEEHLAALQKICLIPCEEYADLQKKIAEYRGNTGK